ncbi:SRPBCC family protein [Mesoterricola silvestris]|uniref:Cyclase n=1 Tax=Mesoterricola silvestris TaxID=2927979 RepID=A0AA48GG57_9BACT|nr:SRPBCC family protein [Mesoterricola silvestris]BDU72161.1 hypothetical protein METEAL_13350 [Mesoterricola silvestris]
MATPPNATSLLHEDHQRAEDLYQRLVQEPSPDRQEDQVKELLQALEIHSWMEERLVYPVLSKACQDDTMAQRLGEGHGEMKRLISDFRLKGGLRGPDGRRILGQLMVAVEDHVADEEAEAFPLLAQAAAHNEELGAELAKLKGRMEMFPPFAQSMDLSVPLQVAYNQWTQFEDFPRFLSNVKEVTQAGPTRVQWRAEAAGKDLRWTSEIYEQTPDSRIAWRSVEGSLNAGSVSFRALDGGSSRILVELTYEPQGVIENLGALVGVFSRYVASNLESYKEFIERTRAESGAWRGKVSGNPMDARKSGGGDVRPGAL